MKKFPNIINPTLWQIIYGNCEKKDPQNQNFWSYLIEECIEKFSVKIFVDSNMTHLLKKKSKTVHNRRTITHSKAWKSSFLDCQCSSTCKFSDTVLSILKLYTSIFQKMHNMICILLLNKLNNVIKKVYVYRIKCVHNP